MGLKLKLMRVQKNMSQEQLAEKSGVSRTTISNIESGMAQSVSTKTLVKLAEALEVTVDDFF